MKKITTFSVTHSIHVLIQIFPPISQKQFEALVTRNAERKFPSKLRNLYRNFKTILPPTPSVPISCYYPRKYITHQFSISQFLH